MSEKYLYGDHVHLVAENFYMPQLNKYRKIRIYLPKGYNKSDKRYPVIYMHDGQNLFHTQPARNDEWAIDLATDELIRAGNEEMIIIGIDHSESERFNEYSPFDGKNGKAEGVSYANFIAETLKPYIDNNYRTLTDVENTAVAGGSMGGLISLYIITSFPDLFGAAGIFSPSLWYAPEIYNLVEKNLNKLKKNKIYFVVGGKEGRVMINDVRRMYELINPQGANKNVIYTELPDGRHREWFWHREFSAFYKFIARADY